MLSCLYYSSGESQGLEVEVMHACMHDMDTLDGGLEECVV